MLLRIEFQECVAVLAKNEDLEYSFQVTELTLDNDALKAFLKHLYSILFYECLVLFLGPRIDYITILFKISLSSFFFSLTHTDAHIFHLHKHTQTPFVWVGRET